MFYSHEVLTSRKYGVATVWLVATLGAKSNLKKINRKAILDVDIQKACQTITQPEAPMALRLQSNLLYGVSRVYSQKCVYVLLDAQAAQNNMKALLKVVRTAELDPDAGKARPEQLVLQDDPAFLPELDLPNLDMDFSLFEVSTQGSSKRTSIMSAKSNQSSQSSHQEGEDSVLSLVIPSSGSGNAGGIGGFTIAESEGTSARRDTRPADAVNDEEGFFPDVDFNFDAEGNLIELGDLGPLPTGQVEPAMTGTRSDSAASAQVRQEHQEGFLAGQQALDDGMELDLNLPADDYGALPLAEPFPEMAAQRDSFLKSSSEVPDEDEPESAEAPQVRKSRGRRALPLDTATELRNSDLAQWNADYVANMQEAARHKAQHKQFVQAKKNAAAWVFGNGLGGVGTGFSVSGLRSPLDMFAGERLYEALTGIQINIAGRKRGRGDEEGETSESEGRRTRPRSEDEEIGRGEGLSLGDDDMLPQFGDNTIELGRDAPPSLEEISSQMPWNIAASLHGSRQGSRQGSMARGRGPAFSSSIGGGFPPSAGGPSSAGPFLSGLPGSFDRRASRLLTTGASPLVGRGQHRPSSLDLGFHDDEEELLGGRLRSDDPALEEFELYGPAAGVTTQTAAESQWVRAALDQESTNFFDFVKAQLGGGDADEMGEEQGRESIAFQELLPPSQHTKIVAAQAFLHVLVLAGKGLLHVQQIVGYGPIHMGVAAGA
ncbi:hypothetical protein MMC30_006856 [Trapelia coarctata]|nr:hypothetical protein [Trapelia coarctata]